MVDDYKDSKVLFSKRDILGKEPKGAKLQVKEKETGKVVKEWISGETPETFAFKPGKYKFVEIAAPKGYKIASSIDFEIRKEGEIKADKNSLKTVGLSNILVMVDDYMRKEVKFSKQDILGKELEGAQIELYRDGEKIDSWVSTKEAKELSLRAGTYTMIETAAPKGYILSTSITFTITADMEITDIKVQGKNKVDEQNNMVVMVDEFEPEKPEVPKKPEVPEKPEVPKKSETPEKPNSPETGDVFNQAIYAGMIAVAGGAFTFLSRKKRKEDQ